jgi:hypothetical protein
MRAMEGLLAEGYEKTCAATPKRQSGPRVRISPAPATRQCEPPVSFAIAEWVKGTMTVEIQILALNAAPGRFEEGHVGGADFFAVALPHVLGNDLLEHVADSVTAPLKGGESPTQSLL